MRTKPLDQLVARYCAHGARIDYFRDPAGLEHIQATAERARGRVEQPG